MLFNKNHIIFILILFLINVLVFCKSDFTKDRYNMVEEQIKSRGIKAQAVLQAMQKVPRHEFVPEENREYSYEDRPLPIGYGQTISQPYIVALMTELLYLKKDAKVLEVGTGSGYQAVILAEIVKEVYTIEIVKELYQRSTSVIKKLGYTNIQTKNDDGYYGWEEHAQFDAIIVTCAAEFVPPPLIKQLKIGGLMCIPVGPPFWVQDLLLIKKKSDKDIETNVITQVSFVPLTRKK